MSIFDGEDHFAHWDAPPRCGSAPLNNALAPVMSISKFLYGVEQPSSIRRRSIHGLALVMGLSFWGGHCDFIPSQRWAEVGWYIALSLGVFVTIFTWGAYWSGRAEFRPNTSRFMKGLVYALVPFISVGFIWVALIHGVGSIISLSLGNETEVVVELSKELHHSRRSCDYRLEGEFLAKAFPSYICIGEKSFQKLPEKAEYKIKGHEHYLGFVADEVYSNRR